MRPSSPGISVHGRWEDESAQDSEVQPRLGARLSCRATPTRAAVESLLPPRRHEAKYAARQHRQLRRTLHAYAGGVLRKDERRRGRAEVDRAPVEADPDTERADDGFGEEVFCRQRVFFPLPQVRSTHAAVASSSAQSSQSSSSVPTRPVQYTFPSCHPHRPLCRWAFSHPQPPLSVSGHAV